MKDGTTLVRLETDDLGAHAAGFVFIHASLLAEWLPTIRATGSPTVVITHKSSAMLAQVVVSTAGGPMRVMQVSLILFSIDEVEVVQQALVLNIPQAKRHEVVMEMFEEQSSPTVFANWLRRGDLAAVLGPCAPLFSPAATGNHRVAGEPPGRVIRRSGSVPVDETLRFLSLSGVEHVNIKLCRQAQEAELGLTSVWAQTTERDELLNQLTGLTHAGFLRTKAGKFIVRCTQEHLPQIRMAIAKEDSRYHQSPDLVVTRKWRVSTLSSHRLSEALFLCHQWHQIPLGQTLPKGRAMIWAPLLGSAQPPPQSQLLIQDHLCVITEIGGQPQMPAATVIVSGPTSSSPSSSSVPPQTPSVAVQMQEGIRQAEVILTSQVQTLVDEKMDEVQALKKQVADISGQMQAMQHVAQEQNKHIGTIDETVKNLAGQVEQRHATTQAEIGKLCSTLNDFALQSRQQMKAYDDNLDAKLETMGALLLSKLGATKKRPKEEDDSNMER
eukprot:2969834-Amphidinium_carterae.1